MDWKKVVANMTNPKTGVMQKFILSPVIPIWNISSVPPNAASICFGKKYDKPNKTGNWYGKDCSLKKCLNYPAIIFWTVIISDNRLNTLIDTACRHSAFSKWNVFLEIVTWVFFPKTRYVPNKAEKTCPITVALAAPTTPQSKTMMKTASNTINPL